MLKIAIVVNAVSVSNLRLLAADNTARMTSVKAGENTPRALAVIC